MALRTHTIPGWHADLYAHPKTGELIEYYALSGSWMHQDGHGNYIGGWGDGAESLDEHLSAQ
jgi:hypothetical protein